MRYRNHNQNTPFYLLYRRAKNVNKLKYKARTGRLNGKMLDSGFYEDQTHGALAKAWVAYTISTQKDDLERKQYYAAVIQKLQRELGISVTRFEELEMCALEFFENNAELFKDDEVAEDEVLQKMMENDYKFGKQYQKEEEGE